jgi:hypothetical protein
LNVLVGAVATTRDGHLEDVELARLPRGLGPKPDPHQEPSIAEVIQSGALLCGVNGIAQRHHETGHADLDVFRFCGQVRHGRHGFEEIGILGVRDGLGGARRNVVAVHLRAPDDVIMEP